MVNYQRGTSAMLYSLPMTSNFYIGFEGPIGAGKTTLAELLAAHIGVTPVLEEVDGNEFLADFYEDKTRWSLGMQLWFLTARHRQLIELAASQTGAVVADYTYAKNGIFARRLLQGRELHLYDRISEGLTTISAQPDLVVYLDAEDDVLLERIRRRNRPYEALIDLPYLNTVRSAYESYLASVGGRRVLRYDTSTLDLTSESELNSLYQRIFEASRERPEPKSDFRR
jgi:deoxyguanosine kinase